MQPENHQQKPLAVTSPQEQQGRKKPKKTTIVFATHKFMRQKELTGMEIVFCGLPYGV